MQPKCLANTKHIYSGQDSLCSCKLKISLEKLILIYYANLYNSVQAMVTDTSYNPAIRETI